MSRPRGGRRLIGMVLLGIAVLLGITWSAGVDVWGAGPRRLTTAVDELDIDSLPLRIAVVGDVQNGLSEFADLQTLVGELQPDLILQLGDTVNNALPGRYAVLHSSVREHGPGLPILSVPGNHDLRRSNGSLDLYESWIGPLNWRLDVGGWRLLGLDNADQGFSPEARRLLEESAEDPPKLGLVLLAHVPEGEPTVPTPTIQFAGHVHSSVTYVDELGTRHIHHGNNCDRSHDADPDDLPTVGILTLREDGSFDWDDSHTVPRGTKLREEFRRLAGGSVYPVIRQQPLLFMLLMSALLIGGILLVRK